MLVNASARAETVTVVADPWCPYNCAPDSKHPGLIIEIVKTAFERHGIQVEYQTLPWTRAVAETRAGRFHAIVGASRGDAPDFIFPETPQATSLMSFFVKEGTTWRYKDLNSLNDITLGSIADYSYSTEIDNYIEMNKRDMRRVQVISGESALTTNLKKLALGRIDSVIEEENVMLHHLSVFPVNERIVYAGSLPITKDQELFAAFSPTLTSSKRYAEILSQETKALLADGTIDKIREHYGLNKQEDSRAEKP